MTPAPRIIIDAGHGGSARAGNSSAYGARGPRGLLEKDVTLDIAKHVVARLGGAAALTRTRDRNLTIGARAARGQRCDVFVSIHANYGAPELWGPEVYVHPAAGRRSRGLARQIAHALAHQAGQDGGGADERPAAMAVLNPSAIGQTAACLVEVDYLSNRRGEERLGDPAERAAIGAAIASAIQQHLKYAPQLEPSSSPSVDSGGPSLQPGIVGHGPLLLSSLQDDIRWDVLEQRLRYGCVVALDVRLNDRREPMSHAYPIDPAGKVKLPMVGLVDALDISLQALAQRVQNLLTPSYYRSPTVNATLKQQIVSYGSNVTQPRLQVRLLDSVGAIQNDSGWYPVRADGTLNLPYVGSVMARDRRLDEVEAEVQAGYRRDYLINAVVHVTPIELDAS